MVGHKAMNPVVDYLGDILMPLLSCMAHRPFQQLRRHRNVDRHKAPDILKGLPPCLFFHWFAGSKKSAVAKGQTLSAGR